MPKFKAGPTASVPTGMFIACPMNQMRRPVKHRRPIALAIMQGPKKCFAKCPCGLAMFLPPDWTKTMGITEREALQQGLLVLTSV